MKTIIRNARVMNEDKLSDLYIADGVISAPFSDTADMEIDVKGSALFPGLIDAHCHLREPGYEYKEDIESGTKSAAKGGFTSVCPMPNTSPVCDSPSVVQSIMKIASQKASCNVFPIGAASKGLKGQELSEIGLMKQAGIVAVSDDGLPIKTASQLRKVMEYASYFDIPVLNHCEDISLAEGAMNEGALATSMGLRGIPELAENIMISRDVLMAEYLNLPIHICHVSTRKGVDIIRDAKNRGVKVTAETCPHYFTLTENACEGYNTYAKMNPPLRTEDDRQAIIEGIADGTIDIIVTDHAPHHDDEKILEFSLALNGIVGFETAFSLGFTYLVKPGHITLIRLVEAMSKRPSEILKLGRGTLDVGAPADIACFDLEHQFAFDASKMFSKSKNTPYNGYELFGRCTLAIMGGKCTYEELC